MSRPAKAPFAVRLPPKLLEELRRSAEIQELTVSDLIRKAVHEYLRGSVKQ